MNNMVNTGDKTYAATKAGYAHPAVKAHAVIQRPAVQAEIARLQTARLFEEALPLAVQTVCDILGNEKAPAGARVQAAKLVFDRTLGEEGAAKAKDPHEMTPEELQKAIADAKLRAAALEHAKAEQARPIIDADPVDDSDVFG